MRIWQRDAERSREVENGGSCLGCQPSEEMPGESLVCAHVLSFFQLCSRDGHLLSAVSSYSSSHPGLTAPAELLLELIPAHLGQNALSELQQLNHRSILTQLSLRASALQCGQTAEKQVTPAAQGALTGSQGPDGSRFCWHICIWKIISE